MAQFLSNVKQALQFATVFALLSFIAVESAHAQRGSYQRAKSSTRLEARRAPTAGPPTRADMKARPNTTGAFVKLSNADTLFELFNPLAEEQEGETEENTPETPIDRKRPGFRGLIFLKYSW